MQNILDHLIRTVLDELASECIPDEEACERLYRRVFLEKGGEENG